MIQALTGLQWAVAFSLVVLGAITVRDWLRYRGRTRLWLAVAVGSLALVGLLGRVPLLSGAAGFAISSLSLVLFMESAFAFVLFRHTLIPSERRTLRGLAAITVAVTAASIVVVLEAGSGAQQITGVPLLIVVGLLVTWSGLVGSSILRLARISASLPGVQRSRLRALNAGFAGLVLAIVAVALAAGFGQNGGVQLAVEVVVLASMPLLGAAFSPPRLLRRIWREREETAFRSAINDLLLYSPDTETLARRAIEWAIRLLGGNSAIIALNGNVIAAGGLDDAAAQRLHAQMESSRSGGQRSVGSALGPTAVVPLHCRAGDGYMAVVAGPFTPLFGDEELQRLGQYGVSITLALDRVYLFEGVRRNAELLDLAYDAVFTLDFDTREIQYWNKAATDLYGFSAAEAAGRDPKDLLQSQYPVPLESITAALTEYDHWEGELLQRTRDGRLIPIGARWALLRDAAGKPLSILQINRDITAEKTAADDLRRARDAAEQASNAKSEYLSRMSHELRTPLAAMLGFSDLLEMREPRDDQVQAIEAIQRAGSHLLSLVNDVLDIARIESGRESLLMQPVDVRTAIDECAGLVAAAAGERHVRLEVVAPAAGSLFVAADSQRLNQVLLNLLTNAIKYGPEGGRVEVTVERGERDVAISVCDEGPGLTDEEQDLLFQPFERLGAERSHVQGTGLGLALCRQLTTAMGGTIAVHSVKGEGATFTIRLQAADGSGAAAPVRASSRSVLSDPVAERTVLYVEDNLATVALVESIFALRPNVRLITAMQGSLAVKLAHEQQPDLIILDLHLPDINGEEVIHRLRDDPRTAEIPVVMYSADATERQVDRVLAAGAKAYLTKPARVSEFLAVLDRALNHSFDPRTVERSEVPSQG